MAEDTLANIRFVKVISKYPCIYDFYRGDYVNRDVVNKAWESVAIITNESVSHCKEKWKNLRTALSRSLKSPSIGSNGKLKEYYLKDAMEFVLPFLKASKNRGNFDYRRNHNLIDCEDDGSQTDDKSNSNVNDYFNDNVYPLIQIPEIDENQEENEERISLLKRKLVQDEIFNEFEPNPMSKVTCTLNDLPECTFNRNPISNGTDQLPTKQATTEPQLRLTKHGKDYSKEIDKHLANFLKEHRKRSSEINPDLEFFKSILPDLDKMNDRQKRQFKRLTLDAIDTVLGDDEKL